MGTLYEDDVIAWSEQQAALLRRGQWSQLDIDNIIEEIESVGWCEKRELQGLLSTLISYLLKWHFQPSRRSHIWRYLIQSVREEIEKDAECASLKALLDDPKFVAASYRQALIDTYAETFLPALPSEPMWSAEQLLSQDFFLA